MPDDSVFQPHKLPARKPYDSADWYDEPIPRLGMIRDLRPKHTTRYTERWEVAFDATVEAGLEGTVDTTTAQAILVERMSKLLRDAGVLHPNVRARRIGRSLYRGAWADFEEYDRGEYVHHVDPADGTIVRYFVAIERNNRRNPKKDINSRAQPPEAWPTGRWWQQVDPADVPAADPLFAEDVESWERSEALAELTAGSITHEQLAQSIDIADEADRNTTWVEDDDIEDAEIVDELSPEDEAAAESITDEIVELVEGWERDEEHCPLGPVVATSASRRAQPPPQAG